MQPVGHAAIPCHTEYEPIAPVVIGIETDGKVFVVDVVVAVAARVIYHFALRMGVPAACRDIQRLLVEKEPDLGLFRAGSAGIRILLYQLGDRQRAAIRLRRACRRARSVRSDEWRGSSTGPRDPARRPERASLSKADSSPSPWREQTARRPVPRGEPPRAGPNR